MKITIKILFICMFAIMANAQGDVLTVADSMPVFPHGVLGLGEYFGKNMRIPDLVRESSASEKAYVEFVVDTNGKVLSPKLIKASRFKEFDKESIRLISAMPLWKPGMDKGKKVNISMTLPVSFKRREEIVKEEPASEEHKKAMILWEEGHKLEQKFLFDKALEKYSSGLKFEPDNQYALFDQAKMHMILGEKEKACGIWKKMVADNIRKSEAAEFVKKYCEIENGPQEMAKYYHKIKGNDFFAEGLKLVNNGRYEAALRKFDSCLKYNPEHKDGLFNKATMHFKMEQQIAACNTWKKLLALAPEDLEVEGLIKKNCN